jgi:hypothetical protein
LISTIPAGQNTEGPEGASDNVCTFSFTTVIEALVNISRDTRNKRFDLFPVKKQCQEKGGAVVARKPHQVL